eukprot:6171271-Amphidinium_carterae.1
MCAPHGNTHRTAHLNENAHVMTSRSSHKRCHSGTKRHTKQTTRGCPSMSCGKESSGQVTR